MQSSDLCENACLDADYLARSPTNWHIFCSLYSCCGWHSGTDPGMQVTAALMQMQPTVGYALRSVLILSHE